MHIVLLITASPEHPNAWHACHAARAMLTAGHRVSVFFHEDAVQTANRLRMVEQGEASLSEHWAKLHDESGLELPLCVAAALRRGVTDAANAARHGLSGDTLHPAFTLAGLGLLTELLASADRSLTFAG